MTPKISFTNLVCGLLPWFKRTPALLSFFNSMVKPLGEMFGYFDKWRSDTRMIINITSQIAVFEGYLRKKYNEPIAIKIVTYDDGALEVCLEQEGEAQRVDVPMAEEEAPPPQIALDGEVRMHFGDADFIVYIPLVVDVEMITAEIERFKQALTQYNIVQK